MSKADKRSETSKSNIRKAQQSKAKEQRDAKIEYLTKKKRLTKKEEEWLNKWKVDDDEDDEEDEKPKKNEKKKVPEKKDIINSRSSPSVTRGSKMKKQYDIEEDDDSESSDEEIVIRPKTKRIIKEVVKKEDPDNFKNEIDHLKELINSLATQKKEKKKIAKQPQINIINPAPQQIIQNTPTAEVQELQRKLINF